MKVVLVLAVTSAAQRFFAPAPALRWSSTEPGLQGFDGPTRQTPAWKTAEPTAEPTYGREIATLGAFVVAALGARYALAAVSFTTATMPEADVDVDATALQKGPREFAVLDWMEDGFGLEAPEDVVEVVQKVLEDPAGELKFVEGNGRVRAAYVKTSWTAGPATPSYRLPTLTEVLEDLEGQGFLLASAPLWKGEPYAHTQYLFWRKRVPPKGEKKAVRF